MTDPIPILLLIVDNPGIHQWMKKNLANQFHIIEASTQQKAIQIAENTAIDFIILDSQFEDCNPLELSKKLRKINISTPILLITGKLKKIFRDAALASGVTDFLNDQLSLEELETRIATGQKIAEIRKKTSDISTLIKEPSQTISRGYFKNKVLLNEKAMLCLADVKEKNAPITLLMVSIDRFQELQESEGLIEIEHLLPVIYERLNHVLRSNDLLIPSSNGMLIVLLPFTSVDEGKHLAEELRRSIQNQTFDLAQKNLQLTISIAVSPLEASEEQYKRLVSYAGQVLSRAKATKNLIISLDKEVL